jgi:hypothetical protein
MQAEAFRLVLQAGRPGFRCRSPRSETVKVIPVMNDLDLPATDDDLAHQAPYTDRLRIVSPSLLAFYSVHNGGSVYCSQSHIDGDPGIPHTGVQLIRWQDWEPATAHMREWMDVLQLEDENDPDHIKTGLAFGCSLGTDNFFVMPLEGPAAGQVFYADHDGWYERAFATSFDGFLAKLIADPMAVATEAGFAFHDDGQTWWPEEFIADVGALP